MNQRPTTTPTYPQYQLTEILRDIFAHLGMLLKLVSDLVYVLVDPRIDFESRESSA